jgi:hypothetical protein
VSGHCRDSSCAFAVGVGGVATAISGCCVPSTVLRSHCLSLSLTSSVSWLLVQ